MESQVPYKQIRAVWDKDTITVYQAYNREIAEAAVSTQNLAASGKFGSRMTWIKPSFLWAMYRSGWSYKDVNQAHILAIKVRREGFEEILKMASVNGHQQPLSADSRAKSRVGQVEPQIDAPVRVQWDPERNIRNEKLPYRSIQIGIGKLVVERWIKEWIFSIEDITESVREWKRMLDDGADPQEVVKQLPVEEEYELPDDLLWITGS